MEKNRINLPRLVKLKDASAANGGPIPLSYQQLAELARQGILPVVRFGRRLFIDPQKLGQFIESGGKALPGGWRRKAS